MEGLFIQLLNMGIAANFVILAVMFLRIILRNMPKGMRCILWGLAGIRLICPFAPQTVLSLIPSAQTVAKDIALQQQPAVHSGIAVLNQAVNPVLAGAFAPKEEASVNPLQIWIFAASVIWLVGIAVMAVYALASSWNLYRITRERVRWKENLYFCDRIDTPFILGVIHSRIYLPSFLNEEQIGFVNAHERAHLARRDHLWKLLGFVLLSIYWYHPLCWAAYWLFCKDLELACDEKAVRDFDLCGRKAYAKTLLECSSTSRRIAAYPLAFGEGNVKERVKNVLNYKKPAFWEAAAAVLACLLVAVCFLTNPREELPWAQEPFGHRYGVEHTVYYAPIFSNMFPPEARWAYELTSNGELAVKEEASGNYDVQGALEEMKLTYENFDQYMMGLEAEERTAANIRKENKTAWYTGSVGESGNGFYYILQQENGEVLLCYGYNTGLDAEANEILAWIFRLNKI